MHLKPAQVKQPTEVIDSRFGRSNRVESWVRSNRVESWVEQSQITSRIGSSRAESCVEKGRIMGRTRPNNGPNRVF